MDEEEPLRSSSTQRMTIPSVFTGYLMVFCASISQALQSFFVHIAEEYLSLSPGVVVLINSTLYLLVCSTLLTKGRSWGALTNLPRQQLAHLFARGLCGALAVFLGNIALQRIPVGTTMTIISLAPVLSALIAWCVLHDTIQAVDVVIVVVNLAGVAIVSQPSVVQGFDAIVGVIAAALSALASAIGFVLVKKMGSAVHYIVFPLSIGFAGVFLSLPTLRFHQIQTILAEGVRGLLVALLSSFFGLTNQTLVNRGMQVVRPGLGLVVRTFSVPCSMILGAIFLAESISLLQGLGVVLVVGSIIAIGLKNHKQSHEWSDEVSRLDTT